MHIYISKSQQTYLYYSGGAEAIIIKSSARVPLNKMFGEIRNDLYIWLHDRMEISSSISEVKIKTK